MLLLAIGLGTALTRWLGYDGRRTAPLRHSFAEAGDRIGGGWSDFVDWLRFGR